jgi:hypothetical protein
MKLIMSMMSTVNEIWLHGNSSKPSLSLSASTRRSAEANLEVSCYTITHVRHLCAHIYITHVQRLLMVGHFEALCEGAIKNDIKLDVKDRTVDELKMIESQRLLINACFLQSSSRASS